MKITLIREERESGKEAVSTQKTDMLMEKLKTENKTGYITELRSIIPHLKGTNARYEHIDRLPRLYPAVEMTRTKAGEHRIKTYNGLILLEVNNLACRKPLPPSVAPADEAPKYGYASPCPTEGFQRMKTISPYSTPTPTAWQ